MLRWQVLAYTQPDTDASDEFTEEQIEAVRERQSEGVVPDTGRVSIWQIVCALAYLGGWSGGKGKIPGVLVITRGWRKVCDYLIGKRQAIQRKRLREEINWTTVIAAGANK